jgi:hypothetical protein
MKTVARRFAFLDVSELEAVFEDYFAISPASYRACLKNMKKRSLEIRQVIPGFPASELEAVSN